MSASIWTFGRGDEQIVIRCPHHSRIVISGKDDVIRQIDFPDPRDRVDYQSALEAELLSDGWSLLSFTKAESFGGQSSKRWLSWIRPGRLFARVRKEPLAQERTE
jgi:hypothetical protein